jgi:aryl-alcohol dehydrogenase-like predicted oxidoreductase
MLYKKLGRTGNMSSQVILGTAAFWNSDQAEAEVTLDLALEAGITHIDIAPQYGNAQAAAGAWIGAHRQQLFVGCKTLYRERDQAWADLENSLKLLHTEKLDLYQFHAVTTMEDVEVLFTPGGAAEAFREAKEQGLVHGLGITGHGMLAPMVHLAALERMDLDTVMFPLNPRLWADAQYRRDTELLLEVVEARDLGVMIIKSAAKRPWGEREKTYNPWYEPYDQQAQISASVRFVLSQPGVTAVVSAGDVRLVPLYIQAMKDFTPMDAAEQEALVAQRAADELIFDGPVPLSK